MTDTCNPSMGLDELDLEARVLELRSIRDLHDAFGPQAFRAVRRMHMSTGYARGFRLLQTLVHEDGTFSPEEFELDPVSGVESFLGEYFTRRGWNMPDIWSEGDTVFLRTCADVFCITEEAERSAPACHGDVCNIYCRAFAEGLVSALSEFFPALVINFHNVSSRRDGQRSDCVEAFQVKWS